MTEDEAKTKSCCGPMQAEFGKTHVVNCIGSACMAWRTKVITAEIHSEPSATSIGIRYERSVENWCGLAGKP